MLLSALVSNRPAGTRPRVIAVFAFRYDAHLVPDLIQNISPLVDGWVAWDDRHSAECMSSEPIRRNALLNRAHEMRADWILAADPDERYEDCTRCRLDELIAQGPKNVWTFQCREMFSPNAYRIDGIWGQKNMVRLFPCLPQAKAAGAQLHGSWFPLTPEYTKRHSNLSFYHLRMITSERRRLRRDQYALADPCRVLQRIGYDYLIDERGMVLESIPAGRGFSPPHNDDGGLWAAPGSPSIEVLPDPLHARLRLIAANRIHRSPYAALYITEDLLKEAPGDIDLTLLAADHAHAAGDYICARHFSEAAVRQDPKWPLAHVQLGRALRRLGDQAGACAAADAALACAPSSRLLRRFKALAQGGRFHSVDALWRRWVRGAANVVEGEFVAKSDIACVVIGYQAPDNVAAAVASLRDQNADAEIVVVNSGGGNAPSVLSDHLPYIRLINVEERLYVGAARNIGIDASSAPFVAFLASDCLALPGWTSARLARHGAGAEAVSSSVVPSAETNLVSVAADMLLYRNRKPWLTSDQAIHYGISYSRRLFEERGYFPTGLRTAEDSAFNRRIRGRVDLQWAPEVKTAHNHPLTILSFLADMRARGRRRAPFIPLGSSDNIGSFVWQMARREYAASRQSAAAGHNLNVFQRLLLFALIGIGQYAHMVGLFRGLSRIRKAALLARDANRDADERSCIALEKLRMAKKLDRHNFQHYFAQGIVLSQIKGKHEAAVSAFKRAHSLNPDKSAVVEALVDLLVDDGHVGAARREIEMVLVMSPHVPRYWEIATRLALKEKAIGPAAYFAAEAMTRFPDRQEFHRDLARIHEAGKRKRLRRYRAKCRDELHKSWWRWKKSQTAQ